jgi:hypothetical protein
VLRLDAVESETSLRPTETWDNQKMLRISRRPGLRLTAHSNDEIAVRPKQGFYMPYSLLYGTSVWKESGNMDGRDLFASGERFQIRASPQRIR